MCATSYQHYSEPVYVLEDPEVADLPAPDPGQALMRVTKRPMHSGHLIDTPARYRSQCDTADLTPGGATPGFECARVVDATHPDIDARRRRERRHPQRTGERQGFARQRRLTVHPDLASNSRCGALRTVASIGALAATDLALAALPKALVLPVCATATQALVPFKAHVPQWALDDLRQRLRGTGWPERESMNDESLGVPLETMKALVEHWRMRDDGRRFERRLNAFAQLRIRTDGQGIHFIHVWSAHRTALPLILTHECRARSLSPSTSSGRLPTPTAFGGNACDAVDVVARSLPGFQVSDKPSEICWNVSRIVKAWAVLMQRLGCARLAVQWADWGVGVTTVIGHLRPVRLAGVHLNWRFVFAENIAMESLSSDEVRAVEAAAQFQSYGSGYFSRKTTRPQTVAYDLPDSPVGQVARIYENLRTWTDRNGNPDALLGRDAIFDNFSLYWLTNTAAPSAPHLLEEQGGRFSGGKVDPPMVTTVFPREIYCAPNSWAQQTYSNSIDRTKAERGSRYAASE